MVDLKDLKNFSLMMNRHKNNPAFPEVKELFRKAYYSTDPGNYRTHDEFLVAVMKEMYRLFHPVIPPPPPPEPPEPSKPATNRIIRFLSLIAKAFRPWRC